MHLMRVLQVRVRQRRRPADGHRRARPVKNSNARSSMPITFVLCCPNCGCTRPDRLKNAGDCPNCGEHHLVRIERDCLHEYLGQIHEPVFDEP